MTELAKYSRQFLIAFEGERAPSALTRREREREKMPTLIGLPGIRRKKVECEETDNR